MSSHLDGTLGIAFDYPHAWFLQAAPTGLLLTSYDPAAPPHKLEWDEGTVSVDIQPAPDAIAGQSMDVWAEQRKQTAVDDLLTVFADERLTLANGLPIAHLTLVSGSGGILEVVLVRVDGRPLEITVQGNFALARPVLNTLRPAAS